MSYVTETRYLMEGITILETIRATETVRDWDSEILIYFLLIAFAIIFLIIGFYKRNFYCLLIACVLPLMVFVVTENPIKKEVALGYDYIVAYVDSSLITNEQLLERYKIIEKDGDIYTLREKEQIVQKLDVNKSVHIHQWKVQDETIEDDATSYTLKCSECQEEKSIIKHNNKSFPFF